MIADAVRVVLICEACYPYGAGSFRFSSISHVAGHFLHNIKKHVSLSPDVCTEYLYFSFFGG